MITDLVFQVAVLKHLKLTMNPINSNKINPGARGEVTQVKNFNQFFFNFFFIFFGFFLVDFIFFAKIAYVKKDNESHQFHGWKERNHHENQAAVQRQWQTSHPGGTDFQFPCGVIRKKKNLNKKMRKINKIIMRKN